MKWEIAEALQYHVFGRLCPAEDYLWWGPHAAGEPYDPPVGIEDWIARWDGYGHIQALYQDGYVAGGCWADGFLVSVRGRVPLAAAVTAAIAQRWLDALEGFRWVRDPYEE